MSFKARYIRSLFRTNRGWVALGTVCVIVTSFTLAVSADFIRQITNHIQNVGLDGLWLLIFLACSSQLIHYITKYGLAVSCRNLGLKLCKLLRVDLMNYWLKMPFASFEGKKAGQYLSIAQNDAENASFYVFVVFSRIGMSVFNVLMALPFMLRIDIRLTAAVFAISIGFGIINQKVLKKIKANEARSRAAQENLFNTALKGYDSADSVKVYNASRYMGSVYRRFRLRFSKALMNVVAIDSTRNGFYVLVQNTTLYGSILFLAWQTLAGHSTLGETLSFNILLTQALVAIEMIFRWSGVVVRCNASWERLEVEMSETINEIDLPEESNVNRISIGNLSYAYNDTAPVFEGLALELEKGKIYRIAGESGSGKTTLIKCLLGLYDTCNAEYAIDGASANQSRVANLISYVPSESFLFEGSIHENLSLGNPEVTKETCQQMADNIGIGDWIRSLSGQLDHPVEVGGQNFSGGQRQMLCILRATLFKRPVLILDEPFSALDSEREDDLRNALLRLKDDYIILMTSHRSQSTEFGDSVILMTSQG